MPGFKLFSALFHSATVTLVALLALGGAATRSAFAQAVDRNLFRGPERERAFVELQRLREIQMKHLDAIQAQPGVQGMGITANRETRELIFGIVLEPEVPAPILPKTIEGVPVRVFRFPKPHPTNGGTGCQPCHD